MASRSPLFQSSIELLGHSIEHFNTGNELDRKLVILHLANAIELILKDTILDQGISIYKNPKETITISRSLEILSDQDFKLPLLNKVELLIDERNALQHRFGSPNELTTIFYMDVAYEFFKILLKENYDEEIDELLQQFTDGSVLAAFKLRQPTDDSELEKLKKVATVHPLGAYLSAMNYYETLVRTFIDEFKLDRPFGPLNYTHRMLTNFLGINIPDELERKLIDLRRHRSAVTHGKSDVSKEDVVNAVDIINEFEDLLKNVNKEEITKYLQEKARNKEDEAAS